MPQSSSAPSSRPSFSDALERSIFGAAWLYLLAGSALTLFNPTHVLSAAGGGGMAAVVHLFALGGILGFHLILQWRQWNLLYAPPGYTVGGGFLLPLIMGLYIGGVAILAWGFYTHRPLVAHLGGHYFVPTAVLLLFVKGLLAMRGRPQGYPRNLAAHLPGLGLMLTVSLGAMLVLEAYQGGYGIYGPGTILVHLLAGAFLFVFPLMLQGPRSLTIGASANPADGGDRPVEGAVLQRLVPLLAAGVLLVAVGQTRGEWTWATPAGLGVLGAVCLWVGLPISGAWRSLSFASIRRTPWAAVGMLIVFAAIRVWRDADVTELLALTRFTAVLFLFVAVLPDLVARMGLILEQGDTPTAAESGDIAAADSAMGDPVEVIPALVGIHYGLQMFGSSLFVAAYATQTPVLLQIGAGIWFLSLAHWGFRCLRG